MSEQAVNGVGVVGHRYAGRNNLAVRFVELEAGKIIDSWLPRMVIVVRPGYVAFRRRKADRQYHL